MTRPRMLFAGVAGFLVLALAAGVWAPSAAHAEDAVVGIENQQFQPDVIVIDPGDTVTWTNLDGKGHAVAFNDGQFQSGLLPPGSSAQHQFLFQGVFLYRCDIHATMAGTVYVGTTPPDGDDGPGIDLVPPTSTPTAIDSGLAKPTLTPTPPAPPDAAATATPGFVPPTPTPDNAALSTATSTSTVAVLGTAAATSTAAKVASATPTLTVAAPATGSGGDSGSGGDHTGLYMGLGIGASLFAVVMLAGLGLAMRRERKGVLPDEEVV